MKPSEVKNLQRGDKVWWQDPDEGIGSRWYTVRRAGTKGLIAVIEDERGVRVELPVQQLSRTKK